MKLNEKDFPLVKKFSIESCLMEGLKDPVAHVNHWVELCALLNKKFLSLKNFTNFVIKTVPGTKLNVGEPAKSLKELFESTSTKSGFNCYESHVRFLLLTPYSAHNELLARAVWFWRAWKFEGFRYEKTFKDTFYIHETEVELARAATLQGETPEATKEPI